MSLVKEVEPVQLLAGDCLDLLPELVEVYEGSVDLLFTDPPYFIGAAEWDRRRSYGEVVLFHEAWLEACLPLLAPNGTLWVSGMLQGIHAIGHLLQSMGLQIINEITWEKTNPRPCGRRRFVHATETVLWAARPKARWCFNYEAMRHLNNGRMLRSAWLLDRAHQSECRYGRYPGQKPLALVERVTLAASQPGDLVLDPFLGSGTTAVAALRHGRRFIGIERSPAALGLARRRVDDEMERLAAGQKAQP